MSLILRLEQVGGRAGRLRRTQPENARGFESIMYQRPDVGTLL
jgi:hypothetical protein